MIQVKERTRIENKLRELNNKQQMLALWFLTGVYSSDKHFWDSLDKAIDNQTRGYKCHSTQ
jgi:hypothetical protein